MSMLNQQSASAYPVGEWNNYARLFASVTTSVQLDVYKEACLHLHGDVVDCGCGSAKLAPFLNQESRVKSYTGLDLSKDMIDMADWVLGSVGNESFSVKHTSIEDFSEIGFSSAVSIQSYYAWPNPSNVLKHIYNMLVPGGVFILATANKTLPVHELAADIQQELLAHPDFEAYKAYNMKLASNPLANFIEMDNLVKQAQEAGFRVHECHQKHFRGGLNFLKLVKRY